MVWWYGMLWCGVMAMACYGGMLCYAMLCYGGMLWYGGVMAWYGMLWHGMVWSSVVWCNDML